MKKSSESQGVSDLLKKLQASYLGGKEPEKTKKEKADADDEKFRQKLAAMLGKATGSSDQSKKETARKSTKKKAVTPKEDVDPPVPPTVSAFSEISEDTEISLDEPRTDDTPTEESATEVTLTEESNPEQKNDVSVPKPRRKRKTSQPTAAEKSSSPEPTVEPTVEPIVESIVEPIVEPIVESIVESSVEPTVEPSVEPIAEPIAESSVEPTVEAIVESSVESIVESIVEPTVEPIAETVAEPITETVAEPIVEPIVESVVETVEEATEETPVETATESVVEAKEEDTDKPTDTVIVIPAPRYEDSADEPSAQEKTTPEPIRIVPRVTLPPRSDAYDFAKKKDPRDAEPIVIRPRTQAPTQKDTIVIRPRTADKPRVTPQLRSDPAPAQPIKIGKEVHSELQTEAPNPTMKKEKNVTFIPPTPLPNDTDKPANDLSTPPKSSTAPAPKKRRLQRFVNNIPVTTVPHDADLEEVLDEPIETIENIVEEIAVEEPEELPPPQGKLSIFQRRQQQRRRVAEEKLSAAELIRKKSGLSEDDVAMILVLGYENELGRLVGYENLKRLKSEHVKKTKTPREDQYGTAFGYRGSEYAGDGQKDTTIAAYVHDRKKLLLRLCLTAFVTLLLLFVEMPHLIGGVFAQTLALPRLLPLVSTLLLVLIAVLSLQQLQSGARAFFRFTPTPYSVPALILPVALLYNLAVLISGIDGLRISLPAALSLLLITVCDVFRLSCELRTLRLISAEGEKHVLVAATPRKKKLRHGKKIVKIINDDDGEPRYEVRRATQTAGFFRRHNSFDSATRPFTVLIYTVFTLATLTAFFGAIFTSSVTSALSTFMITAMLGMPLSAIWIYFYPLCRANRLLACRNCALVGEEAVEELDCPKTLIFRDVDLCTVKACAEIAVRDGDDFRNDLRLSCILFRRLGGTLTSLGDSVPPLAKGDPETAVVRIQDDGVEAMIDHRYHVLAGSAEFLRRSGIRVPRESSDKALRRTADTSPMYVAIDGVLKLNYEVQYSISDDFESLIRDLADADCNVSLYSYDPNLTNAFLTALRGEDAETVCTVKPGRLEDELPLDLADTGAVALGKHTDLVYPGFAANSIGAVRRFGFRMQWISTLLGAGIAVLLLLLGEQSLLSVLAVAGYHVFWLIVSTLATHSEINKEKLRLK